MVAGGTAVFVGSSGCVLAGSSVAVGEGIVVIVGGVVGTAVADGGGFKVGVAIFRGASVAVAVGTVFAATGLGTGEDSIPTSSCPQPTSSTITKKKIPLTLNIIPTNT